MATQTTLGPVLDTSTLGMSPISPSAWEHPFPSVGTPAESTPNAPLIITNISAPLAPYKGGTPQQMPPLKKT